MAAAPAPASAASAAPEDVVDLSVKLYIDGTTTLIEHLREELRQRTDEVRMLKEMNPMFAYVVYDRHNAVVVATRELAIDRCLQLYKLEERNPRFPDTHAALRRELEKIPDDKDSFEWPMIYHNDFRIGFYKQPVHQSNGQLTERASQTMTLYG